MVEEAQRLFPDLDFRVGDAEALDFPDQSFDAAICAFGLLHLPDSERAIAEGYRVLKPGGAYAFSVWSTPEKAKLLGLVSEAVMNNADTSVTLPPGPPFFHFSDPAVSVAALERAGFRDIVCRELPLVYEGPSLEDFVDWFEKSTVRMSALYRLQAPEIQARIREALVAGAQTYAAEGRVRIHARPSCSRDESRHDWLSASVPACASVLEDGVRLAMLEGAHDEEASIRQARPREGDSGA